VVDEDEDLGGGGPQVEADGGTLPIDLALDAIFHVERATSITQSNPNSSAGLFARNIGVRLALIGKCLLHHLAEVFGPVTEELLDVR
jgi:hypothetical protein